ncbi:hypothetical protein GCM10009716_12940 [Streptomyces sodiiphilus]|uniref:Putative zinc-finger domain-containing protein n=1 Tax=Streptomyces sodiiphilus TaxID=226217 RepID=A0ABN2NXC7_9ACTN
MSGAQESGRVDHHLGESLAALIDGELCHDSRDRVLAHLATCPACKAEADAQRRLKSVFAESVLPPPSAGLMARLQALPASEPPVRPTGPAGGPPEAGWTGGLPGPEERETLLRPPGPGGDRGFRIHEPAPARSQRGHRLAFAAAGAFSLAAFAIGGALSAVSPGGPAPVAVGTPSSSVAGGAGATTAAAVARTATASRTDVYTEREMLRAPQQIVPRAVQRPGIAAISDARGTAPGPGTGEPAGATAHPMPEWLPRAAPVPLRALVPEPVPGAVPGEDAPDIPAQQATAVPGVLNAVSPR